MAQDGGKVVSLTHWPPLPPGNTPGTHFCWRLSRPQGHSAIGRIMSMKNSNDAMWNRTSDLPVCSTEPYPLCYRVREKSGRVKNLHFRFNHSSVHRIWRDAAFLKPCFSASVQKVMTYWNVLSLGNIKDISFRFFFPLNSGKVYRSDKHHFPFEGAICKQCLTDSY